MSTRDEGHPPRPSHSRLRCREGYRGAWPAATRAGATTSSGLASRCTGRALPQARPGCDRAADRRIPRAPWRRGRQRAGDRRRPRRDPDRAAARRGGTGHELELVDAYESEARRLAAEAGGKDRMQRRLVDIAVTLERVEAADIVVLHRVVCCYPEAGRAAGGGRRPRRTAPRLQPPAPKPRQQRAARGAERLLPAEGSTFRTFAHPRGRCCRYCASTVSIRCMPTADRSGRWSASSGPDPSPRLTRRRAFPAQTHGAGGGLVPLVSFLRSERGRWAAGEPSAGANARMLPIG